MQIVTYDRSEKTIGEVETLAILLRTSAIYTKDNLEYRRPFAYVRWRYALAQFRLACVFRMCVGNSSY